MTRSRNIMPPRQPWTRQQLATLRRLYANNPTVTVAAACGHSLSSTYQTARLHGLSKSAEYLASPAGGRLDGVRGAACRFKPGQAPANKGLRRPGWAPGRMATTQFRKGDRCGAAALNYVPIGSERINADGYLERKCTDDPSLAPVRRWTGVHRIVWESVNGPVPAGHAVVFLPSRRTTDAKRITLDALELVTRAELMRRNTRHRFPPELNQLLSLKAALTRKINRRTKEQGETA